VGPLSHIELIFHRIFVPGVYLLEDVESHQTNIKIKGISTRDHQTIIGTKGTVTKDHQILLDIWGLEEHIH